MIKYKKVKTVCYFCNNKIEQIDFKDIKNISRFVSARMRILSRQKSGVCATHQRGLGRAIKRAREAALLSYTEQHTMAER